MINPLKKIALTCVLLTAFAVPGYTQVTQNIIIKNGQKIAFLGDSITAMGTAPAGFARHVIRGLEANGIKATMIGAGVGGNTSVQMLARMDADVISYQPDWMILSCGVNDVWSDLPLDNYKQNMTQIVDKAHAANIKVVILTATVIGEDPAAPKNQEMLPYNEFLHQLAKEKKCPLADLNAVVKAAITAAGGGAQSPRGNILTNEGIHMNALGNHVMALGVLKTLGLNTAQLEKAQNSWLDLPDICEVELKGGLTMRQYEQLDAMATKQNRPMSALIGELVSKSLTPTPKH